MPAFLKIYGYYDPTTDAYIMTPARQSIVTSVINIGEFLGAITSFIVGDTFGRRAGLLISMAAIVVGTIFQMADNVLGLLITGRLVVG
jgi:MFS family permease